MLLLELTVCEVPIGNEFALLVMPFEESSSVGSLDFETIARAASRSHMKTSPPRPAEATILL